MGQPNAHITKCDDLDMSLKASLHSTLGQAQVEALFHPLSGQSDLESTFQTPNLTIPNGLPLISRRSSSASCNSRNSIPFRPISGTSIPRSNTMTTNSYTPQSFVLARGYGSRVGPVASQMPISNRAPEAEVLDDPPSLHTGLYTHTHGHKTEGSGLATNLQNDIAKQGKAGSVLARLPVNAPLLERPLGRNDISLCVSGSPCAQKNQHNTTVVGNYRARGEATFSARRAGTLLFTAGGSKAETEAGAEVGASPSPPPQPRTRHRSQPDSGLASTLSGKLDAATRNGPLLTTQQSLLNTHSYGTGHVSSVKGGERVALVSPLTYRSIPPKRPQPFQGALGQTKDLPRSHGRPDDGHAINTARPLKSPPHRTSLLHEETAAAAAATRSVTEPFEETRSHLHTQHQLPLGLRESISAPFDTTPPALLQPMRSSATCDLKIQTTGSSDAPQSRSELESTHAPCRSGHKATFQKQRNSMPVSSLSTSPRGNLNHIYTGPLLDQPTRTGRPPSQPELFNGRRTISHTAEESTSSLHQLATNPLSSAVTSSYSSRSGLTCDSGTTSESGGSSLSVVSSENSNSKGLNDGRSLQHLYLRQTSRTRRSLDTADTGQGRSVSPLALFTDVTQSPTTSSPVIVFEHTPPSPVSATMTVDASCPVSIKHLNTFGTSRDQSTEAVSESSPFSARASGRRIRSMLSVSSRWTLNTSMSQSHSQRSFVGLSENSSNSEIYNSNAGIGDQDIVLDNSSAHLSVSRKPSFDQSRMSGWSASPSISMDFSREHHRIPTGSNINLAQSTVPQSDGSSSSSGRQSIRSAMEGLDKSGRLSTRQINTVLRESELCHQQTFSRAKKILINLCTTEEPTDERSDMQGNNAPSGYLKKEGRISRSVSAMQLIASKRGGMDEIQSPNRSAKAPLAFLSAVKERDPKPVAKERTHRWGKLFRLFTIRRQLLIMFLDVIKFTPLELPSDQVTMLWDKIKSDEQNAAARAIAARLRTLISDRDQFMSKKAVDSIEMLISPHVKSFNKYPYQQRRNFCQLINYEKHPPGKLIVMETHFCNSFYFVLSGKLKIFTGRDDTMQQVDVISQGGSYGEKTMNVVHDRQMTSLATLEIVELLRVDKKDYIEYAKKASAELIGRASQIAATPPFDRYSHIIDRLLPHVQFSSYEPQQTIIVENELNPLLMWVMSGSCRCTKHVPFIKKLTSGTNYGGQLFPYDPALPLEPDNEIVNQLLSISTLSVGDNYPSLPNLPMPTDPRTLIQKFDRNHYLCVLYDQDIAVNSVNLVANTNTEVMFIARNEFVKVAEADLLEYLLESHDGLMSIPLLKLQEAFLQGKQWDSYKKKIKAEYGGMAKPTRNK